MSTLLALDLGQVQAHVFRSNRLRDVIAGSLQASRALDRKALTEGGAGEDEIVVAAGGNALLELRGPDSADRARAVARHVTRRLLVEAPGLTAVAHLVPDFPEADGSNAWTDRLDQLQWAQRELARRKREGPLSVPGADLGIVQACAETGAAASFLLPGDEGEAGQLVPVSRAVRRRRELLMEAAPGAEGRFADVLETAATRLGKGWHVELPREDLTGSLEWAGEPRGGERAAVVHIDGNGVAELLARHVAAAQMDPLQALTEASKALSAAFEAAERAVVEVVAQALQLDQSGQPVLGSSRLAGAVLRLPTDGADRVTLPLRPLVAAGDDLTFLCDGHLAIALAVVALDTLREVSPAGLRFGACAGIAIGGAHAPFSRLRRIAGAACHSAKDTVRRRAQDDGDREPRFALDWHDGAFPAAESLTAWRRRSLTVGGARLTARPYLVDEDRPERQPWSLRYLLDVVLGPVAGDQGGGPQDGLRSAWWQERRSRLARLRDAASRGQDVLTAELGRWPEFPPPNARPLWAGFASHPSRETATVLLDAVELETLHLPLP